MASIEITQRQFARAENILLKQTAIEVSHAAGLTRACVGVKQAS